MAFFVKNTSNPVASVSELGTSFPAAANSTAAVNAYLVLHPAAVGDVLRVLDVGATNVLTYVSPQVTNVPVSGPALPPVGT